MRDSSFEEMAEQIKGLLGIDSEQHSGRHIETNLVHGYQSHDKETGALSTPIHLSATYAHPSFDASTGFMYSRVGNPTRLELENTLALLEGGRKAFAFSSGMAAITTLMKLFAPGDHILVCDDLYGGTFRLFEQIYEPYGISFDYVDTSELEHVRSAMKPETKLIFTETPTNPMMKVVDIKSLATLAHEAGALLAVDNTFLTPYFQKPFSLGADFIIHSGTKYLGGHNDVIAGFLILKDKTYLERIFTTAISEGAQLSPFDSWLMLRSLKTLSVRLERQQENALRVTEYLKTHPHVSEVHYIGDPAHPDYELSCRQASGFGAMISFKVDKAERVKSTLERIKIFLFAESLGGVESLMTYPLEQTHGALPKELRARHGIDDCLLRISLGIENVDDLIADLDQALA